MRNVVEEIEIKVEYYESQDIDPLLEDVGPMNESKSTSRIALDQVSKGVNSVEMRKSETENHDTKQIETWYKSIDEQGKYQCKFCDLKYSTVQTIRHHSKLKHPKEAETLKGLICNNKRKNKFKCHVCNEVFNVISELNSHMTVIHGRLDNFCHCCMAVFNDTHALSEHLLAKHNILVSKLHYCSLCGYKTSKISHFKQHKNTHSKKNMYKCKNCQYSTNYLPNFKVHCQIHNATKLFKCSHEGCMYKGSSTAALRSHKLVHNKKENFIFCDKCTYKTVYKQSLRKHISSHIRDSIKRNA